MKYSKCPNCENKLHGYILYQCKKCDAIQCGKGFIKIVGCTNGVSCSACGAQFGVDGGPLTEIGVIENE
jgi:hypothetical protein